MSMTALIIWTIIAVIITGVTAYRMGSKAKKRWLWVLVPIAVVTIGFSIGMLI